MELKDSQGNHLISEIEYKRILETQTLLPILRNSLSKTWRLADKLMKVLENSASARSV